MNNHIKNKLADECLDILCKKYKYDISPKYRKLFREMYKEGFSMGLYEAQDSIDALLDELTK